MSLAAIVVSRNTTCREMCELFGGTVNGAHRTVTSESAFVGIKRLNETPAREKPLSHNI